MGNRIARVVVTQQFLSDLFAQGGTRAAVCINGVPPGARALGMYIDHTSLTLSLHYEHDSFAEVAEGAAAPVLDVQWRVYHPPDGGGVWIELLRAAEAAFPGRGDAMVREAYRLALEDGPRGG